MNEISRRSLLRTGGVAALGLLAHTALPTLARAHGGEEAESMVIAMGELYFQTGDAEPNAPITLAAGERHLIRLHNEGQAAHEIHFGRDADLEARSYRENLLGTEGEHGDHGFIAVVLEPGEAATVMFVIPETKRGEWEIGCFMPGHYEGGQRAPLIVT
jgi:uncharacterized cupredoxin-like copper-binding protein